MAFEAFNKIRFVVSKSCSAKFRNYLHKKSIIHIKDVSGLNPTFPVNLEKTDEGELNQKIQAVEYILEYIEKEDPVQSSFIENFIPNRPVVSYEEVEKIDSTLDPISLYQELLEKQSQYEEICEKHHQLIPKFGLFHVLKDTNFNFSQINDFKHLVLRIYESNGITLEELIDHPFIENNSIIFDLRDIAPNTNFHVVVCCKKVEQDMDSLLTKFGLQLIDVSEFEQSSNMIYERITRDYNMYIVQLSRLKEDLNNILGYKEDLIVLKDLLTNQKTRNAFTQQFAQTKHVSFIEGFIPNSQVDSFVKKCNEDYPEVYIEAFPTDEPAPVKFNNNSFFRPFEFILRMFGIPRYGMIDPTPMIAISFLIFFGLSFGDVLYGLILIAFCLWGIKRYKDDQGTVDFFKMFLYAGCSATIFGALTASWAGDLISKTYLPQNSFLVQLRNRLVIVDSMEQLMTLLIIVLYIGLIGQMLGVLMAFLQNLKEKSYSTAIFDQLSWLIFLPCAFFFAGNFLAPNYYPMLLITISKYGLILSLMMIFYGGFRQDRRPVIRVVKGLVNIYGIVSTYGIASIFADILSYLRLLALAIATSSMAVSFNMISYLLKDLKIIGPILVILLLVATNMFNLLLSILGAFIHPVRLLFFEIFGRFFQDGGTEYKPFSYHFKNIIVKGGSEE